MIIETVCVPAITNNTSESEAPLAELSGEKYELVEPPPFIPANLGWASKTKEGLVLHLLNLFNAQGRTRVRTYVWNPGINAEAFDRLLGRN